MKLVFVLAWVELVQSFSLSPRGGKGKQDLFWLAVLLTLALSLSLLLWASREGLLNRFMEVSLGYVPNHGIPLWITAEISPTDATTMGREILKKLDRTGIPGLKIFPYHEIEPRDAALPGYFGRNQKIWKNQKRTVLFQGWTAHAKDPLWPEAGEGTSLKTLLNRSLFQQHFQCKAYMEHLKNRLPISLYQKSVSAKVDNQNSLFCLNQGILWLEVRLGRRQRELIPFTIQWKNHFPVMEKVAFLLPLSFFHMIKLSQYNPLLYYFPEAQDEINARIVSLSIRTGENTPENREKIRTFSQCIGTGEEEKEIIFPFPLARSWLDACSEESTLPIKMNNKEIFPPYIFITERRISHKIQIKKDDRLEAPCQLVDPSFLGKRKENSEGLCEIDMVEMLNGYPKATMYVPERTQIRQTLQIIGKVTRLNQFDEEIPALYLQAVYQDALMRFGFINEVFQLLESPFIIFIFVFLFCFLAAQTGIILAHRRHKYAIFLTRGVSRFQIYSIVLTQMTIIYLGSYFVSFIVLFFIRFSLKERFQSVLKSGYQDKITVSNLDLLPLTPMDHGSIFIGIGLLIFIITILQLSRFLPFWKHNEPASLLET